MTAMIRVGSHRLEALTDTGPIFRPWVSSTVAIEIASRYTGNAQTTSSPREMMLSVTPP